jgi:transposase
MRLTPRLQTLFLHTQDFCPNCGARFEKKTMIAEERRKAAKVDVIDIEFESDGKAVDEIMSDHVCAEPQ